MVSNMIDAVNVWHDTCTTRWMLYDVCTNTMRQPYENVVGMLVLVYQLALGCNDVDKTLVPKVCDILASLLLTLRRC